MSDVDSTTLQSSSWRSYPERGTVLGIRLVGGLYRLFGRGVATFVVYWVVLYYALVYFPARRASAAYLERVGIAVSFRSIFRHLFTFGRVTLDRYLFMLGRLDEFDIHLHGHEHLERLVGKTKPSGAPHDIGSSVDSADSAHSGESAESNENDAAPPTAPHRGALLLGAHIGSFEAMRSLASRYDIPLSIIVDFRNAKRINGVLQALVPGEKLRVIEVDPERATSMLEVKACIDRGELVALLGDRATPGEAKIAEVTFLGARALMPTGPYWLAHILACPVYMVAGLFSAPNRYDLYCEPFAETIRLPRQARPKAAAEHAQRFAQMLEIYARKAPYNWFNFYDYWRGP